MEFLKNSFIKKLDAFLKENYLFIIFFQFILCFIAIIFFAQQVLALKIINQELLNNIKNLKVKTQEFDKNLTNKQSFIKTLEKQIKDLKK